MNLKRILACTAWTVLICAALTAQEVKTWTTAEDHQNMMAQLGIRALRPGPSGNDATPNQANYDESKANPFTILPDALTLKNGRKVTSASMWWNQRRPEIVDDSSAKSSGASRAVFPRCNGASSAWRAERLAAAPLSRCPGLTSTLGRSPARTR